jgi:hypothetical protein
MTIAVSTARQYSPLAAQGEEEHREIPESSGA